MTTTSETDRKLPGGVLSGFLDAGPEAWKRLDDPFLKWLAEQSEG